MNQFARWMALACLVVFGVATADAATVYLKDGSQVRGTVVGATAQSVQVHTPDGTLDIASDRILRVDYSDTGAPTAAPAPTPAARPSDDEDVVVRRPRRHPRRYEAPAVNEDTEEMFSLGFGLNAPVSRIDFGGAGGGRADNGNSGLYLGLGYIHDITPRLGAGFNVEYLGRTQTGSQSLLPESNTDVSGSSLLMLATVKLALTDRGPVRPYVLAGLGANHTSTIIDATPNLGFGWSDTNTDETRTLVDDAHWGFASTARVGLDFLFQPTIFTLEFGWNGMNNPDAQATAAGRAVGLEHVTGDLSTLTFAARWGWRF